MIHPALTGSSRVGAGSLGSCLLPPLLFRFCLAEMNRKVEGSALFRMGIDISGEAGVLSRAGIEKHSWWRNVGFP